MTITIKTSILLLASMAVVFQEGVASWGNSSTSSVGGSRKWANTAVKAAGRSLHTSISPRGWSSHENSHHQVHYYQQHGNGNMDLYSLLAGLSFASLLGATIIFLARRNNSGRRRKRSIFDDDSEDLFSPPPGVENWSWSGAINMEPIQLKF